MHLEQLEDQNAALAALLEIKDHFDGENQQSILKAIGAIGSENANEAIISSYLASDSNNDRNQAARTLSYLNPEYPVAYDTLNQLIDSFYWAGNDQDASTSILNAIAKVGGDTGEDALLPNPFSNGESPLQNHWWNVPTR